VILAMGAGRKAAKSINEYLKNLDGSAKEVGKVAVN